MRFIAIALLLAAVNTNAAENSEILKTRLEQQQTCGNFVRYDNQNLYLGFGAPNAGAVSVIDLATGSASSFLTAGPAVDLITSHSTAFVLTPNAIEEWDLLASPAQRIQSYETYAFAGEKGRAQTASAMARYEDKVIIAHGRLGVSIFNIKTKRLVNQFRLLRAQLPLESMAKGVTVQGRYAYVAVDNFHLVRPPAKPAFRGLIVIDMETESVVAELDGLDPGVTSITSDSKSLIVSFGGMPIWKYELSSIDLKNNVLPEPTSRIWKTPLEGHPTGAAMIDDKYYYTCFLQAPAQGENGGRYRNLPFAIDRAALGLD